MKDKLSSDKSKRFKSLDNNISEKLSPESNRSFAKHLKSQFNISIQAPLDRIREEHKLD